MTTRVVVIYEDSDLDFPRAVHNFAVRCSTLNADVVVDAEFADGYRKLRTTLQRVLKDTKDLRGVIVVGDGDKLHRILAVPEIKTDNDLESARLAFQKHLINKQISTTVKIESVVLRWNAESVAMAAVDTLAAKMKKPETFFGGCDPDPRTVMHDQYVHQYKTTNCVEKLSQHQQRKVKNGVLLVDVVNAAASSESERARVLQRLPDLRELVSLLGADRR
jgi:hypothetical protein